MNADAVSVANSRTIADALDLGRDMLATNPDAYTEALLLLQHASKKNKEHLIAHPQASLSEELLHHYIHCLQRRHVGEPIAYITGHKEFWSLPIRVQPGVLIPRPETELLVESALEILPTATAPRILDLGTGSGCIALAIANERPTATIIACDNSDVCIRTAQQNAAALNINNVTFIYSHWFDAIKPSTFDLIVANPPYIADNDPALHDCVRKYEPESALIAAHNGFDALYKIIQRAPLFLKPGATLALEHGWQQGPAVRNQLDACGFSNISTLLDLQGHDRVTIGVSHPEEH